MNLNIEVNEQEANIILQGLGELKAVVSFDLIIKLKTSFESQIKEQEEK